MRALDREDSPTPKRGTEPEIRRLTRGDVVAAVLVAVVFIVAFSDVPRQSWLFDDPQILFGADGNAIADFFFSPEKWRGQSSSSFVPMVLAAFRVDLLLFGFEPLGFYLHALAIGLLAVLTLFLYLQRMTDGWIASAVVLTVVLSPAGRTVFRLLMDRHYVEGLFFAVLVLALMRRDVPPRWVLVLAQLFYLLAMLEKEVYAPLPLLVIAQRLGQNAPYSRFRRDLLAMSVPAIVYITWRTWMLGSVGGYGSQVDLSLLQQISAVWGGMIGGAPLVTPVVGFLVMGILAIDSVRSGRQALLIALAAGIFVILPLLAVDPAADARYVFVATVTILTLVATIHASRRTLLSALSLAAILSSFVVAGVEFERVFRPRIQRMEAEGRYLLTASSSDEPLLTPTNSWFIDGVSWLRERSTGQPSPRVFHSLEGFALSRPALPARLASLDLAGSVTVSPISTLPSVLVMDGSLEIAQRESRFEWSLGNERDVSELYWFTLPAGEWTPVMAHRGITPLPSSFAPPTWLARGGAITVLRKDVATAVIYPPVMVPPRNRLTR